MHLIQDARRLSVARSISPMAAIVTALALGPLGLAGVAFISAIGTLGVGSAFIAVSRHQLANKRNRAFALASRGR